MPNLEFSFSDEQANWIEWHSLASGKDNCELLTDLLAEHRPRCGESLWISKQHCEWVSIFLRFEISTLEVACIGLLDNNARLSRQDVESLGYSELMKYSSCLDLYRDYEAKLNDGFIKALYPGWFPESCTPLLGYLHLGRHRQARQLPANGLGLGSGESTGKTEEIQLRPFRHLDDNWDPDAIK